MDDKDIIALFLARSQDALAAAAEKFGGYCQAIAYNILRDEGDARECVNDAWLSAWQAIPPSRPERLGPFLGKITRNIALNRYKHEHTRKRGGGQRELALQELEDCLPTLISLEQGVEDAALTECIDAWLRSLPLEKRRVFIRRYWYMSPVKEIAREYSISESKAKSMLLRMRRELKAWLDKEGIEI